MFYIYYNFSNTIWERCLHGENGDIFLNVVFEIFVLQYIFFKKIISTKTSYQIRTKIVYLNLVHRYSIKLTFS